MDINFHRTTATILYVSRETVTKKELVKCFKLANRWTSEWDFNQKWKGLLEDIQEARTYAFEYLSLHGILCQTMLGTHFGWDQEILHLKDGYFDEVLE